MISMVWCGDTRLFVKDGQILLKITQVRVDDETGDLFQWAYEQPEGETEYRIATIWESYLIAKNWLISAGFLPE